MLLAGGLQASGTGSQGTGCPQSPQKEHSPADTSILAPRGPALYVRSPEVELLDNKFILS